MKFKKSILCLLLCLTLTGLAACGSSPASLSGTYSAETFGTTMTYTFDEDSVTAQFFMGGYEIGRYEGTYSLNDDETQITLSFAPEQMPNGADLPAGLTSLGGTFTFQQGEDYVMIGQMRYDRAEGDTENSGQGSVPPQAEEPEPSEQEGIDPMSLRLDLPEERTKLNREQGGYSFYAYLSRMRYISRWGLMRNSSPENIQEHSHMVAVLAHALGLISRDIYGNTHISPQICATGGSICNTSMTPVWENTVPPC